MSRFIDWLSSIFSKDPDKAVSVPAPLAEPKWISAAKSQIGVCEVKGGENPIIIGYDATTTLKATEDETPWCSSFVCWCLQKAGLASTRSAWAQSYASYGQRLTAPIYGCIVVFRWTDGTGHVAFYDSTNKNGSLRLLGGNQGDAVSYVNYAKDKVIAYRWPA